MEYKGVLSSAVIGYDSSEDDEIIPNSPDLLQTKHVTIPESPSIEIENRSEIIPKSPDRSLQKKYDTVPESLSTEVEYLDMSFDETHSIHAPDKLPNKNRKIPIESIPTNNLTTNSPPSPSILENEQRSIEAPANSPITPRSHLQNEQRSIEAPDNSPITPRSHLQNEQRSIEAPVYSPITPRSHLQNEQRSIEAPVYSPITPRSHLQNEQRSIEAPVYSPITPRSHLQNELRSIEAPVYSPITPRSHLQNELRSIEAPAYSPITPRSHLQNEQRSIKASEYSPPRTRSLRFKSSRFSASPLPPMSPETRTWLQILEDDVYNSDDSVKDPNYKVDENETDCSDSEEKRKRFSRITVEAEIHSVNLTKKQAKKTNHTNHKQCDDMEVIESVECAENEKDVEKERRIENEATIERNEEQHEIELCVSTEVETTQENEVRQGRPKRGRKRKGTYSRNETKQRKFNNLPYTDRKHNLVEPKEFQNFQCSCKKKCSTVVSIEERKKEFNLFMKLGSYPAQILFITSSVEEFPKKRSYQPDPKKISKPKEFTRAYKLGGKTVCKEMFLKTLKITTQKVNTAMKKKREGVLTDQRGASGGWNKLPSEEYKLAEEVINKLPKYKSHYRRENTDAVFLQPGMTVRKMYEDYYLNEFDKLPDKNSRKCLKFGTFKEFFYKHFNLKCKPLKKDTCNKCDYFATAEKNGINLQEEHHAHLKKAEDLRDQMQKDFQRAQNEENVECLTFDLEKTLPLPRIPTNVVFYKRQLWVYNSGVHRASDDQGFCYIWVEGEAGRGAQEVASCLLQFIENELGEKIEDLILWSDSCGGQNRNIKITLMLKAILNSHKTLKTISMRFLEPGHTFLPNDTDFSKIEKKIKEYDRIYTAEDYINIMKRCKVKNPLNVKRMTNEQFVGCSKLEKGIVNRKVYKDKNKVNWLITKEILLKKDEKYSIFMRSDFYSDFNELCIKKRNPRGEEVEITANELVHLWPNGKEIAKAKLDDLKSMLHLIPRDCRPFYEQLRGSDLVFDDVDRFCTMPDFEVEDE